jgi:hypothetical protein
LENGLRVVGLLSTPRYTAAPPPGNFYSNYVVAYFRALSGAAVEKFPQKDENLLNLAFAYRLVPEISPLPTPATNSLLSRTFDTNLHELRLVFRWPLLPNGIIGNGRQTFRTLAGGRVLQVNDTNAPSSLPVQPLYFLQSSTFGTAE